MGLEESYLKNACDVFQMDTYMYRCVSIIYFTPCLYSIPLQQVSNSTWDFREKEAPDVIRSYLSPIQQAQSPQIMGSFSHCCIPMSVHY